MKRPTVLVVEDEPAIRRGLVDALRFAHYEVIEAEDGRVGLDRAVGAEVDLILLDLMLPEIDGLTILAETRKARPTLPIIILTAKGSEDDRVAGLQGGADDYVVKPFSARELLARVDAVLRRSAERPRAVEQIEADDGRAVSIERREVSLADGERRSLTDREAQILEFLAVNAGRAVSRRELLERVWGLDARRLETRTIDMHVARLRDKLGEDKTAPKFVVTVRGKGYMLGEVEVK